MQSLFTTHTGATFHHKIPILSLLPLFYIYQPELILQNTLFPHHDEQLHHNTHQQKMGRFNCVFVFYRFQLHLN